jgi:hypothetical protein
VSYIERVAAKEILFFIALRLDVVATELGPPLESNVVERVGADEFAVGCVYAKVGPLSAELARAPGELDSTSIVKPSPSAFGKISMSPPKSKLNAGNENDGLSGVLLVLLLRCKPSIWSGSGDGK